MLCSNSCQSFTPAVHSFPAGRSIGQAEPHRLHEQEAVQEKQQILYGGLLFLVLWKVAVLKAVFCTLSSLRHSGRTVMTCRLFYSHQAEHCDP